jgi:MFS family permease
VKKRPPWLQGNVFALGLVALFTDMATEMAMPLLPAFMLSIGAGALALGSVEGAADFCSAILKLYIGRISDRSKERKPWVLFGYSLSSLIRPLFALCTQAWQVVAVRVADRTGKGLRVAARDAMLTESVEPEWRGQAFGFHQSMDHLGAVLGPLLAVGLLLWAKFSIAKIFWFAALPGLLAVLTLGLGLKEEGEVPRAEAKVQEPFQASPDFRAYLIALGVFNLGASTDLFLLMKAYHDSMPLYALPLLWVALHVVKSSTSMPGGWLGDHLGPKLSLSFGWFYYALIYFLFALSHSTFSFILIFVAYGLYYGLSEAPERLMVSSLSKSKERGAAFGYYHGTVGLMSLPASLLFGWLWEAYGPSAAFLSGAGFAVLGLILLWILGPRANSEEQADSRRVPGSSGA